MAKKDERPPYGSVSIPSGERKYNVIRWGWQGLNRTDDIDTGQLSDAGGVVIDQPYVYPNKKPKIWIDFASGYPHGGSKVSTAPRAQGVPVGIFGFDNQLVFLWEYKYPDEPYIGYITKYRRSADGDTDIRQHSMWRQATSNAGLPSSVVQFNVVDTSSGNIVEYTYDRKLLAYPYCYSVPYEFGSTSSPASSFNTNDNPIPVSNFAAVYGSRVFGVSDNAVFGSAYNSYVDYTLDTAEDIASDHAWWSMSQSNTEADGNFTAICTFDNHVVLFKKDYMQLVYNNKNPFRIVDVGGYGCDNDKSWTILNGVLYFASREKVYAFTGGTPKDISKKLEIKDLSGAVMGSYRDTVWLQTKDSMYTYKDGVWSDVGNPFASFPNGQYSQVVQFATLDYGLVGLVKTYNPEWLGPPTYALWYLDWDVEAIEPAPDEPEEWDPDYEDLDWWFETDLMALGRLDVRRVKKFSALTYGKHAAKLAVYLLPDSEKIHIDGTLTDGQKAELAPYKVADDVYVGDGKKLIRVLTRQFAGTAHRLLFVGRGYIKFFAAEIKISWGGELYVTK